MPEAKKLQALLVVARNCAARSETALRSVTVANANELAFVQLAGALQGIKKSSFLTWEQLRVELCAPCSVDMLKSVVGRRKDPSKTLYERLVLACTFYAQRQGSEPPNLPPYLEV